MRTTTILSILVILALRLGHADGPETYAWDLPEGFAPPHVPADNRMTAAKVELGRYLFYDRRISANGTQACGSCHMQKLAFTDGKPRAVGSTGELHPRGSMSLVNIAWAATLTWANPRLELEDQARVPMFGTHPVELGLDADGAVFLTRVRDDTRYQQLFRRAYADDPDPFTIDNVVGAIACFERSIISARSSWDVDWRQIRRLYGFSRDASTMSDAAQRGEVMFFSEKAACFRCHGGANFSASRAAGPAPFPLFHNNGMPPGQPGLAEYSRVAADEGKFKAPTMRNIALTAPYMHDGSIPTLEGVIDHYAAGGHRVANQSPFVQGFPLSKQDRVDLVEFLLTLSDIEVTRDPRFANPW